MTPEELYNRNIKLATYFAKRWFPSFPKWFWEDVVAEAQFGLWRACVTFDSERGTEFSTYAGRIIMNRLHTLHRDFRRGNPRVTSSLDAPISVDSDGHGELTLADVLSVEVNYIEMVEVSLLLEKMPPLLRRVVNGETQRSIARDLGLSQGHVSRLIRRERNRLKKVLKNS